MLINQSRFELTSWIFFSSDRNADKHHVQIIFFPFHVLSFVSEILSLFYLFMFFLCGCVVWTELNTKASPSLWFFIIFLFSVYSIVLWSCVVSVHFDQLSYKIFQSIKLYFPKSVCLLSCVQRRLYNICL